jgi:nitrate reductase gamma subunit
MQCVGTIPLILIVVIALLIGLLAWELFRSRFRTSNITLGGAHDDLFVGLLVLAAFASGSFLTFILLSFAK